MFCGWCSAAQVDFLDFRVVEKVGGIPLQHKVAVFQNIAPAGELQRQSGILLDEQNGRALLIDLF